MKKALALGLTLAAAVVASATPAGAGNTAPAATAQEYRLTTTMTARQMKSPRPVGKVAKARGSLVGRSTAGKRPQVAWTLTFTGLTGRVEFAEVRYQDAGGLGQVILLCAKNCRSGLKTTTTFRGQGVWRRFIRQAATGKVQVILTTRRNPRGELRGLLKTRSV